MGPCYFTGWTAASHWALTDQVFRTTVLKTTARVRASSVRLLDHDYLLSHVDGGRPELGHQERVARRDPAALRRSGTNGHRHPRRTQASAAGSATERRSWLPTSMSTSRPR